MTYFDPGCKEGGDQGEEPGRGRGHGEQAPQHGETAGEGNY